MFSIFALCMVYVWDHKDNLQTPANIVSYPLSSVLLINIIVHADKVVRQHRYSDNLFMMCVRMWVCVWVGVLVQ